MRTLFLFSSFFVSLLASANPVDLSGAYTGCGQSSVFGPRQVIFHLVKVPAGLAADQFDYAAAFTWIGGTSAIYFPSVMVSPDSTKLAMRTEIKPMRDFGTIINALSIEVAADGALNGVYTTNSMTADGSLLGGTWSAQKTAGDKIPALKCN